MEDFLMMLTLYLVAGAVTAVSLDGLGLVSADDADVFAGIVVLWPAFVIKYLAIAAWAVLSAGVGVLV